MIKLVQPTDVAIRPIDDRSTLERNLTLFQEGIPSSSRGVVELVGMFAHVGTDEPLFAGDIVYFDPRFVCEIKELGLLVMDVKSVLLKEKP